MNRRIHSWVLLPALLLGLSGCRNVPDKLNQYMDKAEEALQFRGAVIVAYDGQPILSRGYGLADQFLGTANTPQTKFYIGSITKSFTAAAILILAEQGLLDLNDPVTKYIPDYPHDPGDRITIHHLLCHSSGLPNYTDRPEILLNRDNPMNTEQLINSFKNKPLLFEPGEGFDYSNSGYLLLGEIIERVSGQSYEAFLTREIFKPLQMNNTGYGRRAARYPGGAVGYTMNDQWELSSAVPTNLSILHSAGALYSTAEDLLKWDQALYDSKILNPDSRKAMFTREVADYGYGWIIDSLHNHMRVYHGGIIDGFNSIIERWPEDKLTIIVLSNDDRTPVQRIADALSAICFGRKVHLPVKKTPVAIANDILKRYVGVYQLDEDLYRLITLDDGVLYAQSGSLPRERLAPESDSVFFFEYDNSVTLTFLSDETEHIIKQILTEDDGQRFLAERVTGPLADSLLSGRQRIRLLSEDCDRVAGIYLMDPEVKADKSDLTLTVSCVGPRLYLTIGDGAWVELVPSSPTEFFHAESDLSLSFYEENGEIDACVLSMGEAVIHAERIVSPKP